MPKKPNSKSETALFDVTYEDGSQLSNRRVPSSLLKLIDSDDEIKAFIENQDREIAQRSGRPRGPIKSIRRSR
jgi:hypothetical protein